MFAITSLDLVPSKYKVFRNLFTTQKGLKIKMLHTDGHGSYTNHEMQAILANDGTLHKIRSPYVPEQNAIAERRIRTVVEMARTLLLHSCVPMVCWEDAVLHANYVRNRVSTCAIKGKTPYEVFWGRKPSLEHLKPFGCLVFVLIHKELRDGKFDATSLPGVVIGVSDNHSGYKILMMGDRSVKIARDVRFYEDIFPFRKTPMGELQWMNPSDCPQPHNAETGRFIDPFVSTSQNSAQIDADLASLYAKSGTFVNSSSSTKIGKSLHCAAEGVEDELVLSSFLESRESIVNGMILSTPEFSINDAIMGPDREKWEEAFKMEYGAIMKTGTFVCITPDAKLKMDNGTLKVHKTRPILTVKRNDTGEIARYKVRLVVQGYSMREGVDYEETFSPCARLISVRSMIGLATNMKWDVFHSDVPNAYLNGKCPRLVLVRLPLMWNEVMGYEIGKNGDAVIMANSLYGAPDAGRNWNRTFTSVFIQEGYQQCVKEPCIFTKGIFPNIAIFTIWVDDSFATGGDTKEIERMHNVLRDRFNVKVLGRVSFALGIAFKWSDEGVHMNQTAYIERIIQKYNLQDARPSSIPLHKDLKLTSKDCPSDPVVKKEMSLKPYRSAIGSLLYVALGTRPDIAYAVCALARFSHNPGEIHWTAVKNVIRYLSYTKDRSLHFCYPKSNMDCDSLVPHGWSDASHNDHDDGRSTLGFVICIGNCPISWKSKVSSVCPQSAFESEWLALHSATRELSWLRDIYTHIFGGITIPSILRTDNKACTERLDDRICESNKHFRPKYFLVVTMVKDQVIRVVKIASAENCADIFTKALSNPVFGTHVAALSIY
jgi:hypothetical protein